jgi:hypothetical protein
MSATRFYPVSLLFAAALGLPAEHAAAQPLMRRVAAIGRGSVDVRYAVRPGVCGDGRSYYRMGSSMRVGSSDFGDRGNDLSSCVPGPVRARLRVDGGQVTDVRITVGPARGSAPDADLGLVPAGEAAELMLRIAETTNGRAADEAIGGAVLADSVSVWRRLLAIARDSVTRSRSTRQSARFWVSRFAASKSAGDGEDIAAANDDGDRDDTRNSAIFALAQLKNHEGVPSLLQVARSHRDPALRRQAMFWLAESGDPRGVALFEEILRR